MSNLKSQKSQEFESFDYAVLKIMKVSHDELKRREAEWKKQRKAKKTVKHR